MPGDSKDDEAFHILVFGAAHVDTIFNIIDVPVEKDTSPARGSKLFGGVAYNLAYILSKLGNSVGILTVSGGDSISGLVDRNLQQQNIKPAVFIPISESTTASYTAIHGPDGAMSLSVIVKDIYHKLTVKTLSQYAAQIKAAKVVVCDSSYRADIYEYLAKTFEEENIDHYVVIGSLSEAKEIIPLLYRCKGLFGNVKEINSLAENADDTEEGIYRSLLSIAEHGVESIFATNGDKGVYVLHKGQRCFFSTKVVKPIVCGNGIGNAFAAGVIFGMVNGKSIQQSIKIGLAIAILKLEGKDIHEDNLKQALLDVDAHNQSTARKLLFNRV